jgi:hypothetical protein
VLAYGGGLVFRVSDYEVSEIHEFDIGRSFWVEKVDAAVRQTKSQYSTSDFGR